MKKILFILIVASFALIAKPVTKPAVFDELTKEDSTSQMMLKPDNDVRILCLSLGADGEEKERAEGKTWKKDECKKVYVGHPEYLTLDTDESSYCYTSWVLNGEKKRDEIKFSPCTL